MKTLGKLTNHPVHLVEGDLESQLQPTALIPFCEFSGELIGVKIDQFDVPVCNSFQAKIILDQLCYEVDLNAYYDKKNIKNQLKLGFHFLMDYNEDRQVTLDQNIRKTKGGLAKSVSSSNQIQDAFIYLNTIGKILRNYLRNFVHKYYRNS